MDKNYVPDLTEYDDYKKPFKKPSNPDEDYEEQRDWEAFINEKED